MHRTRRLIVLVAILLPGVEARARTWTDSTGIYSVEADYLDCKDGTVRLKKTDTQRIVRVALERLGRGDQQWIRNLQRLALPAPPAPLAAKPAAPAPVAVKVAHVTEANFEQEVLKAQGPVPVDFYAPWCGPCRSLGPLLEELAAEASHAKIVKVDFDQSQELAARYGVRVLPSLLVFKGGQVRDRQVGLAAKARLKLMLEP